MPATEREVLDFFNSHQGGTAVREVRGDGRRVATRIQLTDPNEMARELIRGARQLFVEGNAVTAVGDDGLNTCLIFQS